MGVGEADIEARDRLSREIVDCETWFRGRRTAGFARFDKFLRPKINEHLNVGSFSGFR